MIFILEFFKSIISIQISKFLINTIIVLTFISIFSGAYKVVMPEVSHGIKYEKNRKSMYFQSNVLGAYYTLLFEASDFSEEMTNRYLSFKKAQEENRKNLVVQPLENNAKMLILTDANINNGFLIVKQIIIIWIL